MRVKKIKEIIWHLETALLLLDDSEKPTAYNIQCAILKLTKLLPPLHKQNDAQ